MLVAFLIQDQGFFHKSGQIIQGQAGRRQPCKVGKLINQPFEFLDLTNDHVGAFVKYLVVIAQVATVMFTQALG